LVISPAAAPSSASAEVTPFDSAHLDLDAIFNLLRLANSEVEDSATDEVVGTKAGVAEKAEALATREMRASDGMENFMMDG